MDTQAATGRWYIVAILMRNQRHHAETRELVLVVDVQRVDPQPAVPNCPGESVQNVALYLMEDPSQGCSYWTGRACLRAIGMIHNQQNVNRSFCDLK